MKLKRIKNLNFFKEKSLNNLLRIVLSSFLMISFFYVMPIFLNFAEKNLITIHEFLFKHYQTYTDESPSSLAVFEKKLRSISLSIKDEFIKKYVLEFFLKKISELTPNLNLKNTNRYYNFKRKINSLKSTQAIYNETKSLKPIEVKEFSFLFIVLNRPNLVKENFHLLDNVKLFSNENQLLFEEICKQSNNFQNYNLNDLEIDQNLIERVFKYASVKHIIAKYEDNDEKVLEILNEIIRDLKNFELEMRISDLESKFSKDLSEDTFNQLKELKKQQKTN